MSLNLTKFDFSKFFELKVLVIEPESTAFHLMKQIMQAQGIKNLRLARSLQELFEAESQVSYDLVFLDFDADPQVSGVDVVARLYEKQLVKPSCQLVLLTATNEPRSYALDYPFHLITCLERPFNKIQIDELLKQYVRAQPFLEPVLELAHKRRFVEAFKLLNEVQQHATGEVLSKLQQLKVAVLLELGLYDAAASLLKLALSKQEAWALWAKFRIDYEQGHLSACEQLLQNPPEGLLPYFEKRTYWSVLLALETERYAEALTQVNSIPSLALSLGLTQLSALVMLTSAQDKQALELLERRRRLLKAGESYCALTLDLCWNQLYQIRHKNSEPLCVKGLITQWFKQVIADKSLAAFANEVIWLQASLVQFEEGTEAAAAFLERQGSRLESMHMSISALCHGAALMQDLGRHQAAFDLMQRANRQLHLQPKTLLWLHGACLYQVMFQSLYAPELRPKVHFKMAERYLKDNEVKLAAKLFYQAYLLSPEMPEVKAQLTLLLKQLKLTQFGRFQVALN